MLYLKILIVEDDWDMGDTCVKLLLREGYDAAFVFSGEEALKALKRDGAYRIVLADLKMPGMDGIELLKKIKEFDSSIEVIIMTGYGTIASAVEAMKLGAADYITKPFSKEELLKAVGKIVDVQRLKEEVARLRFELKGKYGFKGIIGTSSHMEEVIRKIAKTAESDSTVLIYGESGTGKEIVAKAIHYNSARVKGPFIPIDCVALPFELVESELFGHKKGSYTGAVSDAEGLFKAAQGGTIFLDEIAELPLEIQPKLLRILQEKCIRPIGGTEEIPIDVRVIAATNRGPWKCVEEGCLREDLYYRLRVITIYLPPLRERKEDIPLLVAHFIEKFNSLFQRKVNGIEPRALDTLKDYSWPGNVRELENIIESVFALSDTNIIRMEEILPHLGEKDGNPYKSRRGTSLADAEREAVERALEFTKGNKARAAKLLGISRARLYKKIATHNLSV